MKKKPIATISDAIKEVEKMQKSYYYGYFDKVTRELRDARMDELFDYYQKQIKAFLLLAFKRNLTSRVTFSVGINSLRYLEMHIHSEGTLSTHFLGDIGIPIRVEKFKEINSDGSSYWGEYSGTRLIEVFKTLQLFFNHLNDENLYKKNGASH